MARTKFTGPKPNPPENPPSTETTNDQPANAPTAATEAPAPASAAKPKAPGQTRISKRARGTAKSLYKDVLVLYEALTYGVDVKVNHAAVARTVGINEPAARIRYTRLMKRIAESLEDKDEGEDEKLDNDIKEGKVVKEDNDDTKTDSN